IFGFLYNVCTTHPNETTKQTLISVDKQFLSLRSVPILRRNKTPLKPKNKKPDKALTSKDGVSYWNQYDVLGFILSLLKNYLGGATKDNFFLPLTAVYGRWCAKIGGDRKTPRPLNPPKDPGITAMADEQKGVGAVPTILQCTWVADKGGVYFALGSSIAGYDWGNKT
ncbi:hypothetical protein FOXYSP1_18060, partial [Fusarium oxysporum f. sp. phaseoli]